MSQIKTGAILSYTSIFLGTIISIVYTPFMLRMLGQGEYGLMSLANSVVGYLGLLNLGLGSAMTRYISKFKAENNKDMENAVMTLFLKLFSIIALVIFIAGGFLIFNVNGLFEQTLTHEEFHKLQILMGLMTFNIAISMISSVFYAVLMAYERFIFTRLVGVINTILTPLIMLPLLIGGYKAIGITVASTLLNIVNIAIIIFYSFKILKVSIRNKKFEKSFIKELFGFSFFVLLAMIVDKVYWGTDQFILGAVSGTVAVAIYNVGANFTTYFMSFSTAITGMFLPRLTQMDVNKVSDQEFTDLFIKVGRVQFLILAYILGGFIVLGQNFIKLWAGENYSESYWIAIVILIPFVVPLIQNLGLQLLYARNKHKFRSILLLIIAIFNVIISIPIAKLYGGFGCALVTGISFVIGQIIILNWYYYKRMKINIPLFWRKMVPLIITFVCDLGLNHLIFIQFNENSWSVLFIQFIIYSIIYIVSSWLLGMNNYEKELIKSIFQKRNS